MTRWACAVVLCITLIGSVQAALQTVVIDDLEGDPVTGNQFTYVPLRGWTVNCESCAQDPDLEQLHMNTWHDMSSRADAWEERRATIEFKGTAVYVQCALFNGGSENFDYIFYLDGEQVDRFQRQRTGRGYQYNQTVFSKTDLSFENHNLTIHVGEFGAENTAMILDSVIYTYDDGEASSGDDDDDSQSSSGGFSNSGGGGMSPGAIAGIAIGAVAGVAFIAFLLFCFIRRRRRQRAAFASDTQANPFSPTTVSSAPTPTTKQTFSDSQGGHIPASTPTQTHPTSPSTESASGTGRGPTTDESSSALGLSLHPQSPPTTQTQATSSGSPTTSSWNNSDIPPEYRRTPLPGTLLLSDSDRDVSSDPSRVMH